MLIHGCVCELTSMIILNHRHKGIAARYLECHVWCGFKTVETLSMLHWNLDHKVHHQFVNIVCRPEIHSFIQQPGLARLLPLSDWLWTSSYTPYSITQTGYDDILRFMRLSFAWGCLVGLKYEVLWAWACFNLSTWGACWKWHSTKMFLSCLQMHCMRTSKHCSVCSRDGLNTQAPSPYKYSEWKAVTTTYVLLFLHLWCSTHVASGCGARGCGFISLHINLVSNAWIQGTCQAVHFWVGGGAAAVVSKVCAETTLSTSLMLWWFPNAPLQAGNSALHCAVNHGWLTAVTFLLSCEGIDCNTANMVRWCQPFKQL